MSLWNSFPDLCSINRRIISKLASSSSFFEGRSTDVSWWWRTLHQGTLITLSGHSHHWTFFHSHQQFGGQRVKCSHVQLVDVTSFSGLGGFCGVPRHKVIKNATLRGILHTLHLSLPPVAWGSQRREQRKSQWKGRRASSGVIHLNMGMSEKNVGPSKNYCLPTCHGFFSTVFFWGSLISRHCIPILDIFEELVPCKTSWNQPNGAIQPSWKVGRGRFSTSFPDFSPELDT